MKNTKRSVPAAKKAEPPAWEVLRAALRGDVLVRWTLAAFAATSLVTLLQGFGALPAWPATGVPFLLPGLALLAMRRGLGKIALEPERQFWHETSIAWGAWLVADLLTIVSSASAVPFAVSSPVAALRQAVLGMAYVALILAVDRKPHQRYLKRASTRLERLLAWPALCFFLVGLLFYSAFLPYSRGRPEEIATYENIFHVVFNIVLGTRLVYLALSTTSRRWRLFYALTAAAPALLLTASTAGLLLDGSRPWTHLPRIAYEGAFVFLVLAARLRRQPLSTVRDSTTHAFDDAVFILSARTLSLGLVFPVIQLVLELRGMLRDVDRTRGGLVVVISLVVLGGLAFLQYRLLIRRAYELWSERQLFDEQMRTSEQDLRLLLAENTVVASRRLARHKFETVFRSCPLPMAINNYDDARFVEVNEAFQKMTGYAKKAMIGKTPIELSLWESEDEERRLRRRFAARDIIHRLRLRLRRADGEGCVVLMSSQKIEMRGAPALISILREVRDPALEDVGLEVPAEVLRQAEAAVIHVDGAGRVLFWNATATSVFGRDSGEVRDRSAAEMLGACPEDLEAFFDAVDRDGSASTVLKLRDLDADVWASRVGDGEASDGRLLVLTPQPVRDAPPTP